MIDALRKLFFNLIITGTSVFVALAIGTIEWIQVLSQEVNLNNSFFNFINNLNFEILGVFTVLIMITGWLYAYFYYKRVLTAKR